jgi:conjugal transfer pilus assembly protein TraD
VTEKFQFDLRIPVLVVVSIGLLTCYEFFQNLNPTMLFLLILTGILILILGGIFCYDRYSKAGRKKRETLKQLMEVPQSLLVPSNNCVFMGEDLDMDARIYLPDTIRARHIHIIGATGSGKTESVILNFLRQDVNRGLGSVILDAKGDISFLQSLRNWVEYDKLKVFDLSNADTIPYNPLEAGSPLEAAQRLHSSFTWSEEYYKFKALSALQRLFQNHFEVTAENPTLLTLTDYLECPDSYTSVSVSETYPKELAQKDFMELSGLRDQIKSLTTGHLGKALSPKKNSRRIDLADVASGKIIYFRLQTLLSPQIVSILGKLIINNLNFIAGTVHREESKANDVNLIPIYLDEFASFACPEFADLISKARSARMALHFSHQSVGDLVEVSKGFLNRITDNSATKIVLRINDPDSAEFFARSFGTKIYQKITQRITNAKDIDTAEVLEEGTRREAHQFRASPDLFKTLPTGVGSVLIAHGMETPHGASTVFRIKFNRIV